MNSNPEALGFARTTTSDDPGEEEEEDRLSSLHDSILCHILSFLPTKFAAMTSILSTRWKYLFLGVPKIDLDDSFLFNPQEEQGWESINEYLNFINFVNRRLVLCQTSSITEFRLKRRRLPFFKNRKSVIDLWLTTLLFCKVEVLEIQLQRSNDSILWLADGFFSLWLPSGIFLSETLVVLKLCGGNIVLKIPEIVSIPNLKVLHLKDLDMQQSESDNFRLAEVYPKLEDLRLEEIRMSQENNWNRATIEISISTLKVLAIIGKEFVLRSLHIDTPHLQHLECDEGFFTPGMQINLNKGKSLVSADLSASPLMTVLCPGQWFIELLSKVNNVKELHLSEGFSEGLSKYMDFQPVLTCLDSLPQFLNLTHLELTATREALPILLKRTPNLKSLVCNMKKDGNCLLPENQPRCIAENLREIRMRNFTGAEAELETVRYFLQKGAVLERLIIERPSDEIEEWQLSTLKQLLNLERCSPKCKIELI